MVKEKQKEERKIKNYEKRLKSEKIVKREIKIKAVRISILITIIFLVIIYLM